MTDFLVRNAFSLFPLRTALPDGSCSCGKSSCTSIGKHPYQRLSWQRTASSNPEYISKWMSWSDANYAVVTGRRSPDTGKFLIVVDVDAKEHEITKMLPETFSYRTGSGGSHFWFWSDVLLSNSVSRLANKVDIRGAGGYVIIPPSRHRSGNDYEITCQGPIAELPKFIIDALSTAASRARGAASPTGVVKNLPTAKTRSASKKTSTPVSQHAVRWAGLSIQDMREELQSGVRIPSGTRNNTIHKLLSSDRAKGCSLTDLHVNARRYASLCESTNGSLGVSPQELSSCIAQVLKYKPYTTSPDDVNSAFYEFLSRSKTKHMSRDEYDRMVSCDATFFSERLRPVTSEAGTANKKKHHWMTLQSISDARNAFMKEECGFAIHSKYPLPLLGRKLRDMGIERKRTSTQNVWMVEMIIPDKNPCVSKENNELTIAKDYGRIEEPRVPCHSSRSNSKTKIESPHETLHMTTIPALGMTMKVQERIINMKVRKHPSEKRYCGRQNQELSAALLKTLSMLDDNEKTEFFNSTLIVDEEGTALDFDAVQVGDQIGVALPFEDGWVSTILKVESIPTGKDTIVGVDTYTADEVSLTFEEASIARTMGYFEILYRQNPTTSEYEPFGVDLEQKVKIAIHTHEPDPVAGSVSIPGGPTAPISTGAVPSAPRYGVGPAPSVNAHGVAIPAQPPAQQALPLPVPAVPSTGPDNSVFSPEKDKEIDELVEDAATTDVEVLKAIMQAHNVPIAATGPAVPARRKAPIPGVDDPADDVDQLIEEVKDLIGDTTNIVIGTGS